MQHLVFYVPLGMFEQDVELGQHYVLDARWRCIPSCAGDKEEAI